MTLSSLVRPPESTDKLISQAVECSIQCTSQSRFLTCIQAIPVYMFQLLCVCVCVCVCVCERERETALFCAIVSFPLGLSKEYKLKPKNKYHNWDIIKRNHLRIDN